MDDVTMVENLSLEDEVCYDARVEENNDGFFEFISLLQWHSKNVDGKGGIPMNSMQKNLQPTDFDKSKPNKPILEKDMEKFEIFEESIGLNINEFYVQLLHEILIDAEFKITEEVVEELCYLRGAFEFKIEKHEDLLTKAREMGVKKPLLGVEIDKAVILSSNKESNTINPFVTLCYNSNKNSKYETSVKFGTSNPVWGEKFFLPLINESNDDTLDLKIWNFNMEEKGVKKMLLSLNIKNIKSLKLRKNEVMEKTTHNNKLIGKISIPVKNILAIESKEYEIQDKNKNFLGSKLTVSLKLTNAIDKDVMMQEYQYLLRVIVINELEKSKVSHYWWDENYTKAAEAILKLYIKRINLDAKNLNLSNWIVFSIIHSDYPLSFTLFRKILNNLIDSLDINFLDTERITCFWNGIKNILPSCFDVIRNIRNDKAGDRYALKLLNDVLLLLDKISKLNIPELFELIPPNQYTWCECIDINDQDIIKNVTIQAIEYGANCWFQGIIQNIDYNDSEEMQLESIIKIIELCGSNVQDAIDHYDRYFLKMIKLHYSEIIYSIYVVEITKLSKPIIQKITKTLQNYEWYCQENSFYYVTLSDLSNDEKKPEIKVSSMKNVSQLTKYTILIKGMAETQLMIKKYEKIMKNKNTHFHHLFLEEVPQWLDIAIFTTFNQIENAVALDKLEKNHEIVNYSNSAVDLLRFIYGIKEFWEQLAWPDIEDTYIFVIKIIEDVSRCCIFYADELIKKMSVLDLNLKSEDDQNPEKWCFPINNLEYIIDKFQEFVKKLKFDNIIEKLKETKSSEAIKWCYESFHNIIDNSIKKIRDKVADLLSHIIDQMIAALWNKIELDNVIKKSSAVERMRYYLESTFEILSEKLDALNITRLAEMLSVQLELIFSELFDKTMMNKKRHNVFNNYYMKLQEVNQFYEKVTANSSNSLLNLTTTLKIYGLDTSDLILHFYDNKLKKQAALPDSSHGELTIKAHIYNSRLKIEILNARNLKPLKSDGKVNSHIKITFYPKTISSTKKKLKTKICYDTTCPLYENTFDLDLKSDGQRQRDGLIVFNLLNDSNYVAFAILPIRDIKNDCKDVSTLRQMHLNFIKPSADDADIIKSLKYRNYDSEAKKIEEILRNMQN